MSLMDGQNQNPDDTSGHSQLAPDQSVALRGPSEPIVATVVHPSPDATVAVPSRELAPLPAPSPLLSEQPVQSPAVAPIVNPFLDYPQAPMPVGPGELVWTASEFIDHPKTGMWYVVLSGITVIILVLGYLISHDIFTVIAIIVGALLFGYTASRKPRQLEYSVGPEGITIGEKAYPYNDFNAFSVVEEGAFSSVDFMPLKRFSPILTIYYDPEAEPKLVTILNQHLPVAHHTRTLIDSFMHRIRF